MTLQCDLLQNVTFSNAFQDIITDNCLPRIKDNTFHCSVSFWLTNMSVMLLHFNFIVLLSASVMMDRGDQFLPNVQDLGPFTKWMSDPPPNDRIVKRLPLIDDLRANMWANHPLFSLDPPFHVNGRETLRVQSRSKTLAYQPNIDFLRSQNCFALNYQWPSQITLPSITMSLSAKNNINIQQIRASAPSGCFVVLVGGKYVKRMDDIVRKVDYITSQLAIKLVTYFAEKTGVLPFVDLDNLPAIVGNLHISRQHNS